MYCWALGPFLLLVSSIVLRPPVSQTRMNFTYDLQQSLKLIVSLSLSLSLLRFYTVCVPRVTSRLFRTASVFEMENQKRHTTVSTGYCTLNITGTRVRIRLFFYRTHRHRHGIGNRRRTTIRIGSTVEANIKNQCNIYRDTFRG